MDALIPRRGSSLDDPEFGNLAAPGPETEPGVGAEPAGPQGNPAVAKDAPRQATPPKKAPARNDGPWLLAAAVSTAPLLGVEVGENGQQDVLTKINPVCEGVRSIAFVRARVGHDAEGETLTVVECRAGGDPAAAEGILVEGFWKAFNAWKPRLVTFNGRGFLLPILRYASMRNGLTARWLHDAGNGREGYAARFSTNFHVDLMDQLSDCHASPYPSLTDTCFALGFPQLPPPGYDDPRGRAEATAAVVFLMHARWLLYTGKMGATAHNAAVLSLVEACDRAPPGLLRTMMAEWTGAEPAEGAAAETAAVTGS